MPDIHNFAAATLDEDIELVVFGWSNKHGHCDDCGLPAAFAREPLASRLCAVCAANAAADGERIFRLDPED